MGGWADTDKDSPCELMGGMAAELLFGGNYHEAFRGAQGDLKILADRFPGRDWRLALQKSMGRMDPYRLEVGAIAILLMSYRTVSQYECLECMADPMAALREHAPRLPEEAKSWARIDQLAPMDAPPPLCLDDLPEMVARYGASVPKFPARKKF